MPDGTPMGIRWEGGDDWFARFYIVTADDQVVSRTLSVEPGMSRLAMADLVWTANAEGFPLSADDEHHLCQAGSVRPDDWEYFPNLAMDAADWVASR